MNNNYIISIDDIPRFSLFILIFLIPFVIIPFVIFNGDAIIYQRDILSNLIRESIILYGIRNLSWALIFLFFVILGIVLHELIHALTFSLFLPSKLKGVQFGFNKEHGIPFVHIIEPISIIGFRIGAIMPLIILGLFPVIFGFILGHISLTLFGIIFILSSSGDILLINKTRKLNNHQLVEDLPDEVGFKLIN